MSRAPYNPDVHSAILWIAVPGGGLVEASANDLKSGKVRANFVKLLETADAGTRRKFLKLSVALSPKLAGTGDDGPGYFEDLPKTLRKLTGLKIRFGQGTSEAVVDDDLVSDQEFDVLASWDVAPGDGTGKGYLKSELWRELLGVPELQSAASDGYFRKPDGGGPSDPRYFRGYSPRKVMDVVEKFAVGAFLKEGLRGEQSGILQAQTEDGAERNLSDLAVLKPPSARNGDAAAVQALAGSRVDISRAGIKEEIEQIQKAWIDAQIQSTPTEVSDGELDMASQWLLRDVYRLAPEGIDTMHPRVIRVLRHFVALELLGTDHPEKVEWSITRGADASAFSSLAEASDDLMAISELQAFMRRVPDPYGVRFRDRSLLVNRINDNDSEPNDAYMRSVMADKYDPTRNLMKRIAMLGNEPALHRPLGLVLDILIDTDFVSGMVEALNRIAVEPVFENEDLPHVLSSWTAYAIDSDGFFTADRNGSVIERGVLNLDHRQTNDTNTFEVLTIDVEGAGLKLGNFAQTHANTGQTTFQTDAFGLVTGPVPDEVTAILGFPIGGATLTDLVDEDERDGFKEILSDLQTRYWRRRHSWRIKLRSADGQGGPVKVSLAPRAIRNDDDARTLHRIAWTVNASNSSQMEDRDERTPSTRSVGLRLEWRNRASYVRERTRRSKEIGENLVPEKAPVFFSDDLIVGYVPYLRVNNPFLNESRWSSLCRRHEVYRTTASADFGTADLKNGKIVPRDGYPHGRDHPVRAAAIQPLDYTSAQAADGKGMDGKFYVADTLFTWTGQTLTVTDSDELKMDQDRLNDGDAPSPPRDHFKSLWPDEKAPEIRVPELSMTPFRFTHSRNVKPLELAVGIFDRAGNIAGTPSSDVPDDVTRKNIELLRFEPIRPPALLLDEPIDASRTRRRGLTRMVIYDSKDNDLEKDRRVLAPPRITLTDAENMSYLDNVASLEKLGGFDDIPMDTYGNFFATPILNSPEEEEDDVPEEKRARYPIARGDGARKFLNPYYPDPHARVLYWEIEDFLERKITSLDAGSDTRAGLFFLENDADWPRGKKVEVEIERADPTAEGITFKRNRWSQKLRIFLPPAWTGTLRVACGPADPGMLELFGAWSLYTQTYGHQLSQLDNRINELQQNGISSDNDRQQLSRTRQLVEDIERQHPRVRERAAAGANALLSPVLEIELAHAVQRPLRAPEIASITTTRLPGETHVEVDVEVIFDEKSTGTLALHAEWHRRRDDDLTRLPFLDRNTVELDAVRIDDAVTAKSETTKRLRFRHDLGSSESTEVSYKILARSRFIDDFDAPNPELYTVESEVRKAVIPASARPEPPDIDYIFPALEWANWRDQSSGFKADRQFSERLGGNFTLHVKRGRNPNPGDPRTQRTSMRTGEMIGVVLWNVSDALCDHLQKLAGNGEWLANNRLSLWRPNTESAIRDARETFAAIEPYISRWGMDPLQNSKPVRGVPDPTYFPDATLYSAGHLLAETGVSTDGLDLDPETKAKLDASRVAVVAYDPRCPNPDSNWICNISIRKMMAYHPFVRLSVCKFQPNALADLQMSPTVDIGFQQVQPDRLAVVRRQPFAGNTLRVEVYGQRSELDRKKFANAFSVELYKEVKTSGGHASWARVEKNQDWTLHERPNRTGAIWTAAIGIADGITGRHAIEIRETETPELKIPNDTNYVPARRLIYADLVDISDWLP